MWTALASMWLGAGHVYGIVITLALMRTAIGRNHTALDPSWVFGVPSVHLMPPSSGNRVTCSTNQRSRRRGHYPIADTPMFPNVLSYLLGRIEFLVG
jgi:hypothetical protein